MKPQRGEIDAGGKAMPQSLAEILVHLVFSANDHHPFLAAPRPEGADLK